MPWSLPSISSSRSVDKRSPSPPLYESELYARELLPAGHGYPMWIPEASDSLLDEYKENGLSVGDVGIITTDGAFDVLLNITLPEDRSINKYGVPPGFEQLELEEGDLIVTPMSHPPRSYVSSPTISIPPDSEELRLAAFCQCDTSASTGIDFRPSASSGMRIPFVNILLRHLSRNPSKGPRSYSLKEPPA
jgi:hypothetical protein